MTNPWPGLRAALEKSWYRPGGQWRLLVPVAWVYGGVVGLRRRAYRAGWLKRHRLAVPVLVVGNITVGGSGKTPLILALVAQLSARGARVGVIARGYGGRAARYPLFVRPDTAAAEAGDEPAMIAAASRVPVAVDPDRVRAGRYLIDNAQVDCLLADDGLQHYRLARDAEIAVVDGRRGLGNRRLLPAGPLREPVSRLDTADLVLTHGEDRDFWLASRDAVSLDGTRRRPLAAFSGAWVHAVAGIGDPQRFFDMLARYAIRIIPHAMADHHGYSATDLCFDDDYPVFMTEKDAVKCRGLGGHVDLARCWAVPVTLAFSAPSRTRVDRLLTRLLASVAEPGGV